MFVCLHIPGSYKALPYPHLVNQTTFLCGQMKLQQQQQICGIQALTGYEGRSAVKSIPATASVRSACKKNSGESERE